MVTQSAFGTQTSLHPERITIRRIIYFTKLVLLLRSPLYKIKQLRISKLILAIFETKNPYVIWFACLITPSSGLAFQIVFFSLFRNWVYETHPIKNFSQRRRSTKIWCYLRKSLTYAYIITLCFLTAVILKESCLDLYCIKTYWFKITYLLHCL